ncbi:hypothetical protein FJ937_08370 [Mesorhizobium sp. B2-4-4]|uniref:hypothetical protein n=1 Tax=Mesorhizobium sp. B2-4-4 TaxID=2589945 RepID=UPI001127BB04|nr:hypothetical protein [Mesorhizobium sp. B2-4-4]TPL53359.1 hypothetical protein FJ937_08370 [Mesorhizobium sp. B2-4-4]
MDSNFGFNSAEHQAAFHEARRLTQRGGANAPICGARTRAGTVCQNLPIREGKGRCLHHAGPKAAREHRARTYQDFLSGKISAGDWSRAEARRAANRLGWEWKRDPWTPGSTIDLGEEEGRLRADLRGRGVDVDALPPAVADWLRWRFRRTQIDRRDERGWMRVLSQHLSARINQAAERPAVTANVLAGRTWTADTEAGSKRRRADQPRAPKVERGKGYLRRGRPRTQPPEADEADELMRVYREHRTIVAPMMSACPREEDRQLVLRALRDYLDNPNDMRAVSCWVELVRRLRPT